MHIGANLGLGQATVPAEAHFATDLGLSVGAELWVSRHFGVGARAAGEIWTPWFANSGNLYHVVSVYEPQLFLRSSRIRFGRLSGLTGLISAGVGAADVATDQSLGRYDQKVLGHKWYVCGSFLGGATLNVTWFTTSVGLRAAWNGATDWALGPELNLGAAF
jgi:hypothetical protein